MIYILDTDIVRLIVRKNASVIKNLIMHENDEICISAISYAEICFGLEKKGSEKLYSELNQILGKLLIIDFNDTQAEFYGKIRVELEKSGICLDNMDILIAAAAVTNNAILVTHNTKHFSKIKTIKIEDWSL